MSHERNLGPLASKALRTLVTATSLGAATLPFEVPSSKQLQMNLLRDGQEPGREEGSDSPGSETVQRRLLVEGPTESTFGTEEEQSDPEVHSFPTTRAEFEPHPMSPSWDHYWHGDGSMDGSLT